MIGLNLQIYIKSNNFERKDFMRYNEQVLDFLLFSYFGIDIKMIEEQTSEKVIMENCIKRAYLDMCRTISFRTDEHVGFVESVTDLIIDGITELSSKIEKINFDKWHSTICDEMIKKANEKDCKEFSYGQAQKWLNMTFKYMWLLGIGESFMRKIGKQLHVPIDNYILGFLFCLCANDKFGSNGQIKLNHNSRTNIGIEVLESCYSPFSIHKDGESYEIISNGIKYRWSRIPDKNLYISVQKVLKIALNTRYSEDAGNPLYQENKAWLDYAKSHK